MPTASPVTRHSRVRSRSSHLAVGELRSSAPDLANDVLRALIDAEHTVWVDDRHIVYVSRGHVPELPAHWIVGSYMMGASSDAIGQDLTAMWKDRAKNFVIA